jgi:hypothetical protein
VTFADVLSPLHARLGSILDSVFADSAGIVAVVVSVVFEADGAAVLSGLSETVVGVPVEQAARANMPSADVMTRIIFRFIGFLHM